MSERIYIQTGEDFPEDVRELNDEMTWCAERVYESDIEYVRSDILAVANARIERLEAVTREAQLDAAVIVQMNPRRGGMTRAVDVMQAKAKKIVVACRAALEVQS